jgi:hypothetical protein
METVMKFVMWVNAFMIKAIANVRLDAQVLTAL